MSVNWYKLHNVGLQVIEHSKKKRRIILSTLKIFIKIKKTNKQLFYAENDKNVHLLLRLQKQWWIKNEWNDKKVADTKEKGDFSVSAAIDSCKIQRLFIDMTNNIKYIVTMKWCDCMYAFKQLMPCEEVALHMLMASVTFNASVLTHSSVSYSSGSYLETQQSRLYTHSFIMN